MATDGIRIYAIGDIHGELDKLREVHGWIARDRAEHAGREVRIVHLGDYVDRGPDSRGVVDWLIAGDNPEWINLRGNHDRMFMRYVTQPGWQDPRLWRHKGYHWLHEKLGGVETLASYGIEIGGEVTLDRSDLWHDAAAEAVPGAHVDFIDGLARWRRIGDYVFTHAGVRPDRRLEDQEDDDLMWIREGWLDYAGPLPFTVVHGHTVYDQVERYPQRIAVDTGAVFGGELSCIVLDGEEVGTLTAHNVRALPMRDGAPRRP
ncbi:metallophosphoesterase [Pontivivens ytuae]|uniref:metallophosphoesterase n=1 Tax=Pontivivens ytuae TaxID=2789856 RepID=UPI001E561165|nr:metallophosphoesterase [Pontivivens ytuae]